jgi:hypothetical protein
MRKLHSALVAVCFAATTTAAFAQVDEIDHATRKVLLTGPEGNQVELTVDEAVQRLDEVQVGDIVVVRYTEALAMRMIQQ